MSERVVILGSRFDYSKRIFKSKKNISHGRHTV